MKSDASTSHSHKRSVKIVAANMAGTVLRIPTTLPTPTLTATVHPRAQLQSAETARSCTAASATAQGAWQSTAATSTPPATTARRSTKRRASAMQPRLPTPAEFQQLPEPIRRKCFSSVERLRIAQQSRPPLDFSYFKHLPSAYPARDPSSTDASAKAHRIHLKKQRTSLDQQAIAQAEARWFLSLPEKIRRKHFSREEQVLLAARLDLDISGDLLTTPTRKRTRGHTVDLTRRRSLSGHSRSSKTLAEEPDIDGLSEHFNSMNCFEGPPSRRRRQTSIRKTNLSLTRSPTQTILRSSLPSNSPVSPVFPQHSRSRSVGTHLVRASTDSGIQAYDPTAVHYRDPEARSKLRRYLASPQKFDEAVEFGFPSSPPPVSEPEPSKAYQSTSSNDAQSFLKDDVISFMDRYDEHSGEEDEEDDDLSSVDGDPSSPVTPNAPENVDSAFRYASSGTRSIFSSLDSDNLPSLSLMSFKLRSHTDLDFPIANREMTLRMTLTRPDLRAPEEELYGWRASNEPDRLTLEELPPLTDDTTGAQGPFAHRSSRNSGVLKRLLTKVKNKERKI